MSEPTKRRGDPTFTVFFKTRVCAYTCIQIHADAGGVGFLGATVVDSCQLPDLGAGNSDPLEEQQLGTTEPSLLPLPPLSLL